MQSSKCVQFAFVFLRFSRKDCRDTANPGEFCEVVTYDYYGPHLDERVGALIRSKGHAYIVKGGGVTPWQQCLDTHYHALLDREYRIAEQADMQVKLRRSRRLPVSSRQAVTYRSNDSWQLVPHASLGEKSFKSNGITVALSTCLLFGIVFFGCPVLPFWWAQRAV